MSKADRRYQRIATPLGVWVAWQEGARQDVSRVLDLNVGGLFVATTTPVAKGAVVTVLLSVPEGEIRSRAIVRNVTPGQGMGIQFVEMSQTDTVRLEKLVTRLLAKEPGVPT